MITRTPNEIKAYTDGFNACYKYFIDNLKDGVLHALKVMPLILIAVNNVAQSTMEQLTPTEIINGRKDEGKDD